MRKFSTSTGIVYVCVCYLYPCTDNGSGCHLQVPVRGRVLALGTPYWQMVVHVEQITCTGSTLLY